MFPTKIIEGTQPRVSAVLCRRLFYSVRRYWTCPIYNV